MKENINLGKDVATKFNGGGHPKAAGASINPSILTGITTMLLAAASNYTITTDQSKIEFYKK